jgi:hypothetical protein
VDEQVNDFNPMSPRDVVSNPRQLEKLVAFILLPLLLILPACSRFRGFDFEHGARLTGGDPELGRKKLGQHSCVSCHIIPGVPKADRTIAVSLEHRSWRRTFLDRYLNTPENLEQWLQNPPRLKPGTSMPDLSVSPQDSRDMAAYLFSIN